MAFIISGVIFAFVAVTNANENVDNPQGENRMPAKPIEEVLKDHTPELMAIPNVVGTAQSLCNGKPCIKVYVIKITPELEQKIPSELEGYPVEIQETGEIRPL